MDKKLAGKAPAVQGVNSLSRPLASPFVAVPALAWAALVLAVFAMMPWEKEVYFGFERNTTKIDVERAILDDPQYRRTTIHFMSHGTLCEAWLYEPLPVDPDRAPPVVIMAHGLGSQKDMGLHAYAEQFAQAGMAVLVFDYRGFGGSDGDVRHYISWTRHLQDWQSALDFVRGGGLGPAFDPHRVALWGISYSGGHVMMTASKEGNRGSVAAVVANEPYCTGNGNVKRAVSERGMGKVLRLVLAGVHDKARELLGLPPVYIKLVGDMGELALLNLEPQELALSRSASASHPQHRIGGWKNLATPRMLIDNLFYHPIRHVGGIKCPVLFVAGTHDAITPIEHIRKAVEIIGPNATLIERPYGHLQLHRQGAHPGELAPVVDFLRLHLGLVRPPPPPPPHVETHQDEEADAEVL